jgi:hypothetical protein
MQSIADRWSGTIGTAVERWMQNGAEQRRVWVARIASFELRIERDSSRSLASWSVTILVHASGSDDASALVNQPEPCI